MLICILLHVLFFIFDLGLIIVKFGGDKKERAEEEEF